MKKSIGRVIDKPLNFVFKNVIKISYVVKREKVENFCIRVIHDVWENGETSFLYLRRFRRIIMENMSNLLYNNKSK